MMKHRSAIFGLLAVATLALPVSAQYNRIRANIRGGENKCTFEVRVDGVAEIEIHGDYGIIRTLEGNPATWVRLDCGSALPNNPHDFRFKGVDGRGRQSLARDPRGSGGVAVIRIEDPKGGSEGYTGDIFWSGGDSNWGGGGNWSSGGTGWDDGWGNNNSNRGIDYKEAVRVCRDQVARVRNINPNSVSVQRASMGGRSDNYDLSFSFRSYSGNSESGTCSVTNTGRLSNFNINNGGYNSRVSPNEALSVCEREVERRLMVGSSEVRVQHGMDPGNSSYMINWQARKNGQFRSGQCMVGSNGQITDFRK
ncbi:MAG: hypothetical protein IPP47_14035 [Bryobacterales bacterium]|nr:hypothetical protein [Bryobacterales bacterium]